MLPFIGPFWTYGLCNAAAFVGSLLWLKSRREEMGLSENAFWAAAWSLMLGAVIGAKGLFVVLAWEHYASGRLRFFADFGAGFVFFGGLVGATAAGLLFAKAKKLSFLRGADYFAVAAPLGHAVGRLGCLAAGCCHGAPSAAPWAVRFAHPACLIPEPLRGVSLHPVQLYEAVGLLVVSWAAASALSATRAGRLAEGSAFRGYLAFYGALRLLMDPLRGDGRPERLWGLSHQQGLALACLATAALLGARARNK